MLKFIILNGPLQGNEFSLFEGLSIGDSSDCDIVIQNQAPLTISCDSSGSFSLIASSKKSIIDVGGEKLSKLEVLPGLIFSIGEVGFSIQEGETAQPELSAKKINSQELFDTNEETSGASYPLAKPVRFDFVRGALLNTKIEINWHPFSMGAKSNLHHFVDEHINLEDDILALERSTEKDDPKTLIRPFISNFISINKKLISKPTIVSNGDLVEFSDTAFYIRIK